MAKKAKENKRKSYVPERFRQKVEEEPEEEVEWEEEFPEEDRYSPTPPEVEEEEEFPKEDQLLKLSRRKRSRSKFAGFLLSHLINLAMLTRRSTILLVEQDGEMGHVCSDCFLCLSENFCSRVFIIMFILFLTWCVIE
jgi:hypothetical protein